jgi:hypothetical protein
MTIYKCDRCGGEMGRVTLDTPQFEEGFQGHRLAEQCRAAGPQSDRHMAELCESCWVELEVWLKV